MGDVRPYWQPKILGKLVNFGHFLVMLVSESDSVECLLGWFWSILRRCRSWDGDPKGDMWNVHGVLVSHFENRHTRAVLSNIPAA